MSTYLCTSCLATDDRDFQFCAACGSEARSKLNSYDALIEIPASAGMPCQSCFETGRELKFRRYRRVVAFFFGASLQDVAGYFCSGCRTQTFFERQGTTLLTGWWGLFALLFYNPYAIFLNFYALGGAPPSAGAFGAIDLDDIRNASSEHEDFEDLYESLPTWLSNLSEDELKLVLVETDYYAVLGVPSSATEAEIKSAYRHGAKIYHPDTGGEMADSEVMSQIISANQVLGEPHLKLAYDQSRED